MLEDKGISGSAEYVQIQKTFLAEVKYFAEKSVKVRAVWRKVPLQSVDAMASSLDPLSEQAKKLSEQAETLFKKVVALTDLRGNEKKAVGKGRNAASRARKAAEAALLALTEQLRYVPYFQAQALWLAERFPGAAYRDVPGLCKIVGLAEMEKNDWSLTPGRYVGVTAQKTDENFNFAATIRTIHEELDSLNAQAIELVAAINKNFEGLGV
jgi:type I restriction enzyme M protein